MKKLLQLRKSNFGLLSSKTATRTRVVTLEVFNQVINSANVQSIVESIQRAKTDDEVSALKGQLPAFVFMAQCEDGGDRPKNATAKASGLCMHDFDHLEGNVRELYINNVEPHRDELNVVLAHTTPSGHGLRLVTLMNQGESVEDCQLRVAKALGFESERDEHVKDLARLSFAVSKEYVHFVDEKRLFEWEEEVKEPFADDDEKEVVGEYIDFEEVKETGEVEKHEEGALVLYSEGKPLESSSAPAQEIEPNYEGIPMERILDEVVKRVSADGEAKTGSRNNILYKATREMRPLFGTSFQLAYKVIAPKFIKMGLSDEEVRRTIASALGSQGGYVKTHSPLMRGVLTELALEYDVPMSSKFLKPMPELPKILDDTTRLFPESLREAVFMALLPMLGTIGTGVRFRYIDGQEHSLSFLTHIIAPQASNKGFIRKLSDIIMYKIKESDAIARQAEEEERMTRMANQNVNKKLTFGNHTIRLIGGRVTAAVLYKRLNDAKGKHLFLSTEEISGLTKSLGSAYGGFKETLRFAFDNAEDSKETLNDQSPNFHGKVYMNLLTCGTDGATRQFFKDAEDGLASRFIPVLLPDNLADDIPVYLAPSNVLKKKIDSMIDMLENENSAEKKPYDLGRLEEVTREFLKDSRNEFMENQNEIFRRLSYRSAVIGFRAGVLVWLILGKPNLSLANKKPSKKVQMVLDIARWVAEYVQYNQYYVFGTQMEEQIGKAVYKPVKVNNVLFSNLPMEFSLNDLALARQTQGLESGKDCLYKITSRWTKDGLVKRDKDKKMYVKIGKIA